jgi:endonuclease/exonuclease/phosphatase family metal-dependent hydrolase
MHRNERQTRILTWNINSDRRVELQDDEKYKYTAIPFADFSVHQRFTYIAANIDYLVKEKQVSLLALQEVEDSVLPKLKAHLESIGLNVITAKYNPTPMAFNLLFAYDPAKYCFVDSKQIYLTLSGTSTDNRDSLTKDELFAQNLNQPFEKSSLLVHLRDNSNGNEFCIVNNHLGLSNKHRLLASNLLCSKLSEIKLPMVLVGDFNQFDDAVPEARLLMQQIEVFENHGFNWTSKCLQTQHPGGTFVSYPYDIDRFLDKRTDLPELDALKAKADYEGIRKFYINKITEKNIPLFSTSLDAVFEKNTAHAEAGKPSRCKALLFGQAGRIKPVPDAATIHNMALASYQKGICELPSDHLPVLAKVRL